MNTSTTLVVLAGCLALAGCATDKNKNKPLAERGWIGGDYVLARHQSGPEFRGGYRGGKHVPPIPAAGPKKRHPAHASAHEYPAALAGLHERDLWNWTTGR